MSLNRGPSRKLSASDGAGKHGSNRHIHNHCNTLNSTARRSRHTSHDGGHGPNIRRGPNRHGRRERSDRPCGRPCDPYGRPCHLRNFSLRRSRSSTRRKALPLAPSPHFSFSSSDVLSLLDGGARRSPQVRALERVSMDVIRRGRASGCFTFWTTGRLLTAPCSEGEKNAKFELQFG